MFQQFVLESLGHASCLLGSDTMGEALVLDVRRDVDVYFQTAQDQGLRLAYALDTHQHNDYVTGICELSVRGEVPGSPSWQESDFPLARRNALLRGRLTTISIRDTATGADFDERICGYCGKGN